MAKTQWLTAACTLAMMAAVPALAQQTTQGTSSMPQTSPAQSAAPATTMPSTESGQMSQGAATSGKMHHAMGSHMHHPMRAARGSDSQNAAVDKLNEQSFQAAQQGQSFNGSSTSMGGMTDSSGGMSAPGSMSGGSGGMGAMPSGSAGTPSGDAGMSGGKM